VRAILDVVVEKKSISALPRTEPNSKLKLMKLPRNRTVKVHAVVGLPFNVNETKIMVNPSATHMLEKK
jgi:hypothetical protein